MGNFELMAPLGFAACSEGLKKGNNYILYLLKRGWMLTYRYRLAVNS